MQNSSKSVTTVKEFLYVYNANSNRQNNDCLHNAIYYKRNVLWFSCISRKDIDDVSEKIAEINQDITVVKAAASRSFS